MFGGAEGWFARDEWVGLNEIPRLLGVLVAHQADAWTIFLRDMTRVCQYFASQRLKRDARKLASDLWTSHGHKITREVHPQHLDPEKKEDRSLWEKQRIDQ